VNVSPEAVFEEGLYCRLPYNEQIPYCEKMILNAPHFPANPTHAVDPHCLSAAGAGNR
jgi:hypothetical protein